ncbi:MAG: hypothetical protein LWX70_14990 [Sphingobacteriia bacterium]|nr:hypothetical protein [Sphingobacteriia bacterium]
MISRIPASKFQFQPFKDQDIINAYNWFKTFISEKDWQNRKAKIEKDISVIFNNRPQFHDISKGTLISIQTDRIGWYLYLIYTLIYEPYRYDHHQGARIMPIFKRIGINLELVRSIEGIDKKVKDLLRKRPSEADAILFEILTALLWVRNGWEVKIIEEEKTGVKSPDFQVTKNGTSWQIECKRQSKTGEYAYKETTKRQIMISHIGELLIQHNVLLNIKFHIELVSLPDTYLRDILTDIIQKTKKAGTIISNATLDVELSFVNINSIQKHLKTNYVKNHSPQLIELIANKPVDNSSFTCGIKGNYVYVGDGEANNLFVSEIYNAFGVQCYCDAEKAINAKARDVKSQIYSAMKQFYSGSNGIIHIGMETFDGPHVEKERAKKIMGTLGQIDAINCNLRWIYFHFFQSYSRSYEDWIIDETVDSASAYVNSIPPLQNDFLILPEDLETIEDGSHWERQLP